MIESVPPLIGMIRMLVNELTVGYLKTSSSHFQILESLNEG
jgi:hypothetical protein